MLEVPVEREKGAPAMAAAVATSKGSSPLRTAEATGRSGPAPLAISTAARRCARSFNSPNVRASSVRPHRRAHQRDAIR